MWWKAAKRGQKYCRSRSQLPLHKHSYHVIAQLQTPLDCQRSSVWNQAQNVMLQHNQIALTKIGCAKQYANHCSLHQEESDCSWIIICTNTHNYGPPTLQCTVLIRLSCVTGPAVLAKFSHLSCVTTPMAEDFWWIQKMVKRAF